MYAVDDTGGRRLATAAEGASFRAEREQKHTPGPWMIDGATDVPHAVVDNDGMGICEVDGNPKHHKHDATPEQFANAALIAAAPDMYEALQTVRLVFPEHPSTLHNPTRVMVESVLAALAKAEG